MAGIAKAGDLDIASALELSMSDEQEAKFMALRALHAKKIKQLMVSIEAKEKEVAKLKVLGKDSRRSQMIQALRGKIKDMEVVQDTIKEEFARKTDKPLEEINDFVIRKTCGGPKRFRPLSREEMENKIIKYERQLERLGQRGRGIDGGKSMASQAKSIANTAAALTSIATRDTNGTAKKVGAASNAPEGSGASLAKVAHFMEEINGLRNALDVAQGALELQKEEVVRLRQRNADMAAEDEVTTYLKMATKEAQAGRANAEAEARSLATRLAAAEEVVALMKSGSSLELEQSAVQLDALQSHCEKLLKQNSSLLHRLADMETELDEAHERSAGATDASRAAAMSSEHTQAAFKDMEKKLSRYSDKLKMSESLLTELQTDNAQIGALREQLRGKNITIKELTHKLSEIGTGTSSSANNSPIRVATAGNSSSGDAIKVAQLKDENTKLKQALQVAVSGSGAESIAKAQLESTSYELEETKRRLVTLQALVDKQEGMTIINSPGRGNSDNSTAKRSPSKLGPESPSPRSSPRSQRQSPRVSPRK